MSMTKDIKARREKRKLLAEFAAESRKTDFDRRIPNPEINYNQLPSSSYQQYYREYVSQAVLRELPELLKLASFSEASPDFAMLDYGCGLGRLAFAFTNFFGKSPSRHYFGYEIHPSSYAFLTDAYRDFPNTTFINDPLLLHDSYVEMHQGEPASVQGSERIGASQVDLQTRINQKLDLQFSHSVFTHMYRAPIIHILKEFNQLMKPQGICVNTWFIVDRFAHSALHCGLADRELPFEFKEEGFYTYLQENPLMCTAYKLEQVLAIYESAGHEILDIRWGTWTGRLPTHQISYQDMVISKPKA
jgi:SAM-dependent methyltransferase